jgi:hypothetical protein
MGWAWAWRKMRWTGRIQFGLLELVEAGPEDPGSRDSTYEKAILE